MLRDDVDMTDEEEEERRQIEMILARRKQMRDIEEASHVEAVVLDKKDRPDKDIVNEDLEQLIKANGDDIEYEFFANGEEITPSQTIYEVLRIAESR